MYTPTQRLMRSRNEKIIAGVAGGIASYLAIDPVIVRLAFVGLIFTGVGILAYPILWLVMPLEPARAGQATQNGEAGQVFVASGPARQARFDPQTGQPLDPNAEAEIPIQNVAPGTTPGSATANRNRTLGLVLLVLGGFVIINTFFPGAMNLIFPLLLVGLGVILLRRGQ